MRDPHAELPGWVSAVARAAVLVAWVCATVSAGFMTVTYQLGKYDANRDSAWVAFALLSVGLACDLWVGAAPILLPKALPHRPVIFVVALASFLLAVQLTAGNKVGFWGQRADGRIELARAHQAAAAARAASLERASDAALLAGPAPARAAEVVEAEISGLEAEIAGMERDPDRWRTKLFERRQALTAARVEAASARAFEAAAARASGAATAAPAPDDAELFDPRDRWIARALHGWGAELAQTANPPKIATWLQAATPASVETWMHGLQALFHELFCFVGLVLVGLGRSDYERLRRVYAPAGGPHAPATAPDAPMVEPIVEPRQPPRRDKRGLWGRLFGGMDQGWRAFAREVVYDSSLIPRPEGRPIPKGRRLPGPPAPPPAPGLAVTASPTRLRRNPVSALRTEPVTVTMRLGGVLPGLTLSGLVQPQPAAGLDPERAAKLADARASVAEERAEAASWRAAGHVAEADARDAELDAMEAEIAEIEQRWAAEPNREG